MSKIKDSIYLRTVRKKVFFVSKLTGGIIVLFYLIAEYLPVTPNGTFLIWLALLFVVIFGLDSVLDRIVSKPLKEITGTANHMAALDFTERPDIKTKDEFGELSTSSNTLDEK